MQKSHDLSLESLIRATAGAGKTTGLLEDVYRRYKKFKEARSVAPRILISTFTVKAANELLERLMLKAGELGDQAFLEYVNSSQLEVGTMHSVFSKILLEYEQDGLRRVHYVSNGQKSKFVRLALRQSLKKESFQSLVKSQSDEKMILDLFLEIRQSFFQNPVFANKSDVLGCLKQHVFFELEKLNSVEFLNWSSRLKDFDSLTELLKDLENKSLEDKEFKKSSKDIIKFLKAAPQDPLFLNNFVTKQEQMSQLYKEWKKNFDNLFEDYNLSSLEDTEMLFYKELLGRSYKKRWDYCFFDEHQDTSPLQKKIIDLLTQDSVNYYVGDPYQSIYFFRGARKEIFERDYDRIKSTSTGEVVYRRDNYRSGKEIVDFVNCISEKMLSGFLPMTARLEDVKSSVSIYHAQNKKINAEFDFIFEQIQKNKNLSSVILSRGTRELLACGRTLKKRGLRVEFALSKGFEASLEVIELVSFLKFLKDPRDSKNLLILFMSEWFEVSDQEIQQAYLKMKKDKEMSLWDAIDTSVRPQILAESLSQPYTDLYSVLLEDFLLKTRILESSCSIDESGKREENILKLLFALKEEELKSGFSLLSFCEDILSGAYAFEAASGESADADVTLMTVHGSKGLQFDRVFILAANKQNRASIRRHYSNPELSEFAVKSFSEKSKKDIFPLFIDKKMKSLAKLEKEELKRLFYVAMTRAKTELHILGSGELKKSSQSEPTWLQHCLEIIEEKSESSNWSCSVDLEEETLDESVSNAIGLEKRASKFFNYKLEKAQGLEAPSGEENSLLSPSKSLQKIREGIFFHEVMERYSEDSEDFQSILKAYELDEDAFYEALDFLKTQDHFPFEEIMKSGEREWGFDMQDADGSFVSGKIDLWGRVDGNVWILDYKTGTLKNKDKGFEQLGFYESVLRKHLKKENLVYKKVLCFPFKKQIFVKES